MFTQSFLLPKDSDASTQIANQSKVLAGVETAQLASMSVAYGLMTVFLPVWIPLVAMACDLFCDLFCINMMPGLDPMQQPMRYRMVLLSIFIMEIAYSLPCLVIWQNNHEFAKAAAVALLLMTLFQLCSVRSLHLPFGIAGWLAVSMTTLFGNGYYWLEHQNVQGFLISSLAILAAMFFTMGVMRSNHDLHQEISKRGVAADAANHAKGRFMAQMSHELRTPLNAILGMGEAELAQNPDSETKARMATLVSSTRGLAVILDDILEMTALDEAALKIRPVAIVPAEIIATVSDLFRTMADKAGLILQVEIDEALQETAMLDPNRLRQCLSNLLSNALKYTSRGGVHVTAVMTAHRALQIDIVDTGPGISAPDSEALFTPFERGNATQQGSGLGLAISRSLARQMDGDLQFLPADQPNSLGAHFRLTLPMPPATPQADVGVAVPKVDVKGKRILVVDDIATNRLVACTHLRLLNALPEEAASGAEALTSIAKNPPDLVLLDLNMPELSGIETLKQIRTLMLERSLPVLAMTAYCSAADRRNYLAAGLDGVISKPLTSASLALALAQHFPKH